MRAHAMLPEISCALALLTEPADCCHASRASRLNSGSSSCMQRTLICGAGLCQTAESSMQVQSGS